MDNSETRKFFNYLSTNYPSVSVNIYSGKDWITNQLNKWSQLEASITGDSPIIKELQDTVSDSKPSIHKLLLIDEPEVYPGHPPKTPKHGFSTDSLLLIQR